MGMRDACGIYLGPMKANKGSWDSLLSIATVLFDWIGVALDNCCLPWARLRRQLKLLPLNLEKHWHAVTVRLQFANDLWDA